MRFEWREAKNRLNRLKHGLGFEVACKAFADPFHKSVQDRYVDGEERWQTIGLVQGVLLVLVAHTYHDRDAAEVIRIISARRATRQERRLYEE